MSGGSYGYACWQIEDVASEVRQRADGNLLRIAFADHLDLCAKAMHDIEWVDSSDYAHGDEDEAIKKALSVATSKSSAEVTGAVKQIEEMARHLGLIALGIESTKAGA